MSVRDDPDFLVFHSGRKHLEENGIPVLRHFILSSKATSGPGALAKHATTIAQLGEITGDGYERNVNVLHGQIDYGPQEWSSGIALNWSADVRSVVMVSPADVPLCAWNLRPGGLPRNLSLPSTSETSRRRWCSRDRARPTLRRPRHRQHHDRDQRNRRRVARACSERARLHQAQRRRDSAARRTTRNPAQNLTLDGRRVAWLSC